ncbi:MAG: hypothetical protein V8R64_10885 [Thomasclavelia sp.]
MVLLGGQTSIEVAYGKNIVFTKVDEHDKPVADAEFTVYDGHSLLVVQHQVAMEK